MNKIMGFINEASLCLKPLLWILCTNSTKLVKSQGFWDGQSAGKEFREQLDAGDVPEEYSERPRKSRKSRRNRRISADDLEVPMDFL